MMDVGDGMLVIVDLDMLLEFAVFVPVLDLDDILHRNLISPYTRLSLRLQEKMLMQKYKKGKKKGQ